MKFANLALAVAIGSAVAAPPKAPQAKVKIDCTKPDELAAKAPRCEVRRTKLSARPDLFQGVKPKPKAVRL